MSSQTMRKPSAIPNQQMGMMIFIATEVMFFLALVSSYLVIRARDVAGWAPPGDITLPVVATAFNTAILMLSGLMFFVATRYFASEDPLLKQRARTTYFQAVCLGTFFVVFQGYEWIKLVDYGMTMASSIFGATFFLLIGSHGLHAAAGVVAMAFTYRKMVKGTLDPNAFKAMFIFWAFIVVAWPFLYGLVYF